LILFVSHFFLFFSFLVSCLLCLYVVYFATCMVSKDEHGCSHLPRRSSRRRRQRRSSPRPRWTSSTGDQVPAAAEATSSRTATTGSVRRCRRPTLTVWRRGSHRRSSVNRSLTTPLFLPRRRLPPSPTTRAPVASTRCSTSPPPIAQISQVRALTFALFINGRRRAVLAQKFWEGCNGQVGMCRPILWTSK